MGKKEFKTVFSKPGNLGMTEMRGKERDEGVWNRNKLNSPSTKIMEVKRASYDSLKWLIPSLLY